MLLALRDVTKTFPGARAPVLAGASMDLAAGDRLALTGESGSGKSTLLHLAAGLDLADSGSVTVEGAELSALTEAGRARLRLATTGLIFQHFNLIPALDAAANIAFQARLSGRHDAGWTAELTARLGLIEHRHKYPEALSGGQQQRVAIGRALAARPRLVLADEPTGNLDEQSAGRVLELLLGLTAEAGVGLLVVTHSPLVAAAMDRKLVLHRGQIT